MEKKNIFKGKIEEQNGYYFVELSNKKRNIKAIIIDLPEPFKYNWNEIYKFEAITMIHPLKGYLNVHVVRKENNNVFNFIGTNGNVDELKDLLLDHYLPNVVKLIK